MFPILSTSLHPSFCPPLRRSGFPTHDYGVVLPGLCLQGCLLLAHSPQCRQARPLLSSSHLTPADELKTLLPGLPGSVHCALPALLPAVCVSLCYNYLGLSCFSFWQGSVWGNVILSLIISLVSAPCSRNSVNICQMN